MRQVCGAFKVSIQADNEWDEIEVLPYCPDDNKRREYYRQKLARVSDTGLGPWEISIFDAIWFDYGQLRTKEELARRAFPIHLDKHPTKAFAAIEKCFSAEWIQFLTVDFLDRMQRELADSGYLIPKGLVGHESPIGLISFTHSGASLYQRWIEFDPAAPDAEHWCVADDTNGFYAAYGTTVDQCEFPINESESVVEREPAVQIGRWCDRWWNRFERGFRIRYRTTDEGCK